MSAVDVTFVASNAGLDELRDDWERCHDRSAGASIFVSYDWLRCWWAHYSGGRALRVAVAREEGRVTGILPLYLGTAPLAFGARARVLRLLGSGADTSPDYLGPVVERDHAAATLNALCQAVVRSAAWDAVEFTDVLDSSPFTAAMETAFREAGLSCRRTAASRIPIARLPGGWPEYLASLGSDRVKTIRRTRRQWDAIGARFFVWSGAPPLDSVVDRLAELHRLRWQGRAEQCAFSSPPYVAFHRGVMHALASRGRLRLYCLALGDRLVALYYCYALGDEVAHFQSGFDPLHARMSPGSALMAYAIEQAITDGAAVFDMLKGDYAHKARWANDSRATVGLRAYRPTVRGAMLELRREVVAPVVARHRTLPDPATRSGAPTAGQEVA